MLISKKMTQLSSAIFTELNAEKQKLQTEGRTMIDFSIGTPDLPPSPQIMEQLAQECLIPQNYRYAINDSESLIQAVSNWYKNRYNVSLSSNEILSLLGSQSGFAELALCLIDPEDLVLVPSPSYPIFTIGPLVAHAKLYKMPLLKENNYLIDLDAIPENVAKRAKLMIVSYPNNPTTATAPREFYIKLVEFARKHNIIVLHDNAYSELVFDGSTGESFLSIPGAIDVGIEFNSLSKTYNIPGCRIAFAVGNAQIISALKTLKSHLDYGMFLPFQKIAINLLTGPQESVNVVHNTYKIRGRFLVNGLNQIGWSIPNPQGSMFIWAPIPEHYTSSLKFTYDLMYQAHVIVVPGISFGEEGEGYVRIALVQDEETMQTAIDAIANSGILNA